MMHTAKTYKTIPDLRGRFPFRIGTTSYILEAGLADNLRFLADHVDEMQLVLFDTDGLCNIPGADEARALRDFAVERGFAFTVHLPGSIELGDPDPGVRRASRELFLRTVEATRLLSPICWVFHAVSAEEFRVREKADPGRLRAQVDRARAALAELIGAFDNPRDLAIENVLPYFDIIEPGLIEAFDTSTCIDVGHLVCYGQKVWEHLDAWLPRCRNIHLHGTDKAGRDHTSLAHLAPAFVRRLFLRIADAPVQTATMEIFGIEDFHSSMAFLDGLEMRA